MESHPDKVAAIHQMELKNINDVRRFLGMANQLSKFIPNLADMSKPLRDLLAKKNHWCWDQPQMDAFASIKKSHDHKPSVGIVRPQSRNHRVSRCIFIWPRSCATPKRTSEGTIACGLHFKNHDTNRATICPD